MARKGKEKGKEEEKEKDRKRRGRGEVRHEAVAEWQRGRGSELGNRETRTRLSRNGSSTQDGVGRKTRSMILIGKMRRGSS
jgi:hypothetical protein